ncbi:MAG: Nramp family divalent metal transporter [Gemmatimonadetes bacterium]|nr:Nramp family divalent metal transporter [Gemmatimonadota bacterium]
MTVRHAPPRSWGEKIDPLRWLGPGFVLAATAIGASHLVLAPTAGASFGYALLWVMLASHLVKYPAFEFGPRFAIATGTSLLDGYARVPGPRGWALGVFLLGTIVQGVTVLAGVLGVAAAVAHLAFPAIPIPAWSLILGLLIATLLATGGFDGLSALSKWMLMALTVMTAFAFVIRAPGAGFLEGLVVPRIPAASVVLFAAVIGWMPTGIDVAVWHSMWALERRDAWSERGAARGLAGDANRRALRIGQLDMRLGYGLSAVLAVMFLALGAEVLRPAGLDPMQGADVAIALARLYTETLGAWIFPVFMTAAFFGMFSTAYGVMDGFPRAFSEGMSRLVPSVGDARKRLFWGFLFATLALAIAETLWIPNPVILVTIAAVVSFLVAPVLCVLNHYCVTRLIDEPALRPGTGLRLWSILGILSVTAATVFYLWVQLGPG